MDRATDQIERHLDRERAVLLSNLEELEDRVRSVVDWRRHYRSNPSLWIGVAFGGGLLMALAARRHAGRPERLEYTAGSAPPGGYSDHRRREISRAWRTIESALIGVAATKLKETLLQVLPGFREQLARREGDGYAHDPSAKVYRQH
jgi:pimeloyl-ACP methyl ester carboxylesterase